jgi:hypothetical protein
MSLSLYTTISRTSSKSLNLSNRNEVEVTVDGVLESRSCYSELKSLTLIWLCEKTVDKTARERVTTTYTVDDWIYVITL